MKGKSTKPSYDKEKLLIDIKRKIKEGYSSFDITEWIKKNYDISRQYAHKSIQEARELVQREIDFNYRDIMINHCIRYENIWKKNFKNPFSNKLDNPDDDLDDKDVRKTLYKIAKHYDTAANALRAKEKMLGLTQTKMDIDIHNEFFDNQSETSQELDVSKYNLAKLDFKEKLELLELLKIAKGDIEDKSPIESITTTVAVNQSDKRDDGGYDETVVNQFDVEDIEHEEVIESQGDIYLAKINEDIIKKEATRLNDELDAKKEEQRKVDRELAKKNILKKYRNKKK